MAFDWRTMPVNKKHLLKKKKNDDLCWNIH